MDHRRALLAFAPGPLRVAILATAIPALACGNRTAAPVQAPVAHEARRAEPSPGRTVTDAKRCLPLPASAFELPPLESEVFQAEVPLIEDDADTLTAFHQALIALVRGTRSAPIRIAVYGDSNMTQDGISGGLRRALQLKFGDAGHGYVALGRAWPWYMHMDVHHAAAERAWTSYSSSTNPPSDRILGFANMAFDSKKAGAFTWVGTADPDAPVGTKASRFELHYLEGPRLGAFDVTLDGGEPEHVDTSGAEIHARTKSFDVADGAHRFELRASSNRRVRVFGLSLERTEKGIVVDSLGTGALNYVQMTHVEDKTRNEMLLARHYDLVLFHLGANIFGPGETVTSGWTKEVVLAHRRAVPGVPVLILSPADIDRSKEDKKSDPRIVALVGQLRRAATTTDSAYWDFWSAMGGHMSMKALRKKGLASTDLIHFVRKSAVLMGDRLAHALVASTASYADKHPEAGCAP